MRERERLTVRMKGYKGKNLKQCDLKRPCIMDFSSS